MLLGTLIPVIADGYKKILHMIDCEANLAVEIGLRMSLSPDQLNVPPGMTSRGECCPVNKTDLMDLSPSVWRVVIRSLLRWDVYGSTEFMPSTGLKGIVNEMEARAKSRHELIKTMRQNLQPDCHLPHDSDEKDRLCTQVLEASKVAMSDLIIP